MIELEFKYKFSKNYLKFKLFKETNEVLMDEIIIDYEYPKIFFLLLRNAFDKFISEDYKTFVQMIMKEDWDIIKNLDWKIRKDQDDILTIVCPMEEALINIAHGLGFNE